MKQEVFIVHKSDDPLMAAAVAYAVRNTTVTVSAVQHKLGITPARAAKLTDVLEERGFIVRSGVLNYTANITAEQFEQTFGYGLDEASRLAENSASRELDPVAYRVLAQAVKAGGLSLPSIRRRFSLGRARAERIIEQLEERDYIEKAEDNAAHAVRITEDEYKEIFGLSVSDVISGNAVCEPAPPRKTPPEMYGADAVKELDPIAARVMAYAIEAKTISVSAVQRKFSVGYVRSARIIEQLEEYGFIGPSNGFSKPREVYMTAEQYKKTFGERTADEETPQLKNPKKLDSLTKRVLSFAILHGNISTTLIQNNFSIGYAHASRLIDELESYGFISAAQGNKSRMTLITEERYTEIFGRPPRV